MDVDVEPELLPPSVQPDEHIGSTSVPGLVAKPVIDCDIVVAEQDVSPASETLVVSEQDVAGSHTLGERHAGQDDELLEPAAICVWGSATDNEAWLSMRPVIVAEGRSRVKHELRSTLIKFVAQAPH